MYIDYRIPNNNQEKKVQKEKYSSTVKLLKFRRLDVQIQKVQTGKHPSNHYKEVTRKNPE